MRTKAGKMRDSIMRNLGARLRSFTFWVGGRECQWKGLEILTHRQKIRKIENNIFHFFLEISQPITNSSTINI